MLYNYTVDTCSLYLHWPFCPYRCRFCPFIALAGQDQYMGSYQEALQREIGNFSRQYRGDRSVQSVYLGGGTPSTWPNSFLLDTFGTLKSEFNFEKTSEITIEVNPGTVAETQVACWKELGINRVSVGVQSLNDRVLHKLGRYQTAADVCALMPLLAKYVTDISVDLIIGLPGVSRDEWLRQLEQIVQWPVTHLSLYFLSVDPFTRLEQDVRAGRCVVPGDDDLLMDYYGALTFLKQTGFVQYEISNFARPGYESKHNQAYWERKPYKGFGLGAWSYDGTGRFQNQTNLTRYMQGVCGGEDITIFSEKLTQEQVYLEKIMLGLRQTRGVSKQELFSLSVPERQQQLREAIERLVDAQLLIDDDGQLRLTPAGLALQNKVVVELSE